MLARGQHSQTMALDPHPWNGSIQMHAEELAKCDPHFHPIQRNEDARKTQSLAGLPVRWLKGKSWSAW